MIKLSICIATYNRAAFIGETLESILTQMPECVELVVVDGASPDNTPEVVSEYLQRYPKMRYVRESENSGVDRDYDKAVGYARGEFCWLMTDDDVLLPGAIARVLQSLDSDVDLLLVNSQVRTVDLGEVLSVSMLKYAQDRIYTPSEWAEFFSDAGHGLSFIGGTVIRRAIWMARDRVSYFGTLFIHVGVIFQAPFVGKMCVLGEPLIQIRYGNAMWTSRGFEIWMFKWPELIWSFKGVSDESHANVISKEPWKSIRALVHQRGIGAYGVAEYRKFIAPRACLRTRFNSLGVALIPGRWLNMLLAWYYYKHGLRMGVFEMTRSRYATWVSRKLSRCL